MDVPDRRRIIQFTELYYCDIRHNLNQIRFLGRYIPMTGEEEALIDELFTRYRTAMLGI